LRGLNKKFKENPIAFLNRVLLIPVTGEDCPTCHRPISLNWGIAKDVVMRGANFGDKNAYFRPDPQVFTFDLIGGEYKGSLEKTYDLERKLSELHLRANGCGFDSPYFNYANLVPMQIGSARKNKKTGFWTHEYSAYWLPWSDRGVTELHLDDLSVKFFFTATFSGCTFAVATPSAGRSSVWVTHIAWEPGRDAPADWGGGQFAGVNPDERRISAELAFYSHRLAAGQFVRSVTHSENSLTFGGNVIKSEPIDPSWHGDPNHHKRFRYGKKGRAFIVGWRDEKSKNWRFAVQRQPIGYQNYGFDNPTGSDPAEAVVPYGHVMPVAVQRFF